MDHFDDLVFIGVVFLIIGAIYVAPTFIAFRRNHPNRWIILVINIAFGGTIIGWGIAMVRAMRAAHRVGDASSGGDSGLNLFINDVRKFRLLTLHLRRAHLPCKSWNAFMIFLSEVRFPRLNSTA